MKVRWGIAGTGTIAAQFAKALAELPDAEVVAVASRSAEGAERFGSEHCIAHRHPSYEALAGDADVDVVYVATPNSRHASDTTMYLGAGKAVLCEKPLATSAEEARAMVDAARASGLFLMDAMWSRFVPAYRTLREVVTGGTIGDPLLVEADLGFAMPFDPSGRLFDPLLGGGATLDLGVYLASLCSMVLGPPSAIGAVGTVGRTGVDELAVATLQHGSGAIGVIKASIASNLSCAGRITGSAGSVEIPAFVHAPDHLTVNGGRVDCSYDGDGLRFEAAEVHRCLRNSELESPTMPLDESVQLMATLDVIRDQVRATSGSHPSEPAAGQG